MATRAMTKEELHMAYIWEWVVKESPRACARIDAVAWDRCGQLTPVWTDDLRADVWEHRAEPEPYLVATLSCDDKGGDAFLRVVANEEAAKEMAGAGDGDHYWYCQLSNGGWADDLEL